MKIIIIGNGAREHAIETVLSRDTRIKQVFTMPGNGGTLGTYVIQPDEFERIKAFALKEEVKLIIIGSEIPLADGIVDFFADSGINVFGPDQYAAKLESSKIFAHLFATRYNVTTPEYGICQKLEDTIPFLEKYNGHVVVKYDGLAGGKGSIVCGNGQDVVNAVDLIKQKFGADARFLVEERLYGQEISLFGITDGETIRLLQPARDYKPLNDHNEGPNTGGMGAYTPVDFCGKKELAAITDEIVLPTLNGIKTEQLNYKGVVYFGIMITDHGPKLLEYNVRFGDPEAQVVLPALKTPLLDLFTSVFDGTLQKQKIKFHSRYFLNVVIASGGYPGPYKRDCRITGLDTLRGDSEIFHAGTRWELGEYLTTSGRVLSVVNKGKKLKDAARKAYDDVTAIYFENYFHRTDIGYDLDHD